MVLQSRSALKASLNSVLFTFVIFFSRVEREFLSKLLKWIRNLVVGRIPFEWILTYLLGNVKQIFNKTQSFSRCASPQGSILSGQTTSSKQLSRHSVRFVTVFVTKEWLRSDLRQQQTTARLKTGYFDRVERKTTGRFLNKDFKGSVWSHKPFISKAG